MSDSAEYSYRHPRPALAADCVVLADFDGIRRIALVQRGQPPFEGQWALPGGFVRETETSAQAARRELAEETGLGAEGLNFDLHEVGSFTEPGRDPRGWIVSHAYAATLHAPPKRPLHADSDARSAEWFDIEDLPPLAFDHDRIVRVALDQLSEGVRYKHPRPMVAADVVVLTIGEEKLYVALVQPQHAAFDGKWALPGRFLREGDTPEDTARLALARETSILPHDLKDMPFLELGSYGAPGRDPRGWTITLAYLTFIPMDRVDLLARSDARSAQWFPADELPELAFDHERILLDGQSYMDRLVSPRIDPNSAVIFSLLPAEFTIRQAQMAFQASSSLRWSGGNFHKWINRFWNLEELKTTAPAGGRPPKLYRFIGMKEE